jgi:Ser/Thr protein kinase RdoA (MazF antagonist)
MVRGAKDVSTCTREFIRHLLRGSRQTNRLDPKWLQEIPYFLKLREIELYAVIHRSYAVGHIDDRWCERYMRDRKDNIAPDVPYSDFESLSVLF